MDVAEKKCFSKVQKVQKVHESRSGSWAFWGFWGFKKHFFSDIVSHAINIKFLRITLVGRFDDFVRAQSLLELIAS
jgi:hypothetical protein